MNDSMIENPATVFEAAASVRAIEHELASSVDFERLRVLLARVPDEIVVDSESIVQPLAWREARRNLFAMVELFFEVAERGPRRAAVVEYCDGAGFGLGEWFGRMFNGALGDALEVCGARRQ